MADAGLYLCRQHQIATGTMLRSIAGFGSPATTSAAIAADTKPKIDKLLEPVLAMKKRGLPTFGLAQLLRNNIGSVELLR